MFEGTVCGDDYRHTYTVIPWPGRAGHVAANVAQYYARETAARVSFYELLALEPSSN